MSPRFWVLGSRFLGLGWLREPMLWGVLLVGLVAWTLAYQWPYTFHLAIGGDPVTHRRKDDRPFLQPLGQPYRENASFNASQPQPPNGDRTNWWQLPEKPYRWTTANAIMAFPGIGGGRWLVEVRASGQPTGQPTLSRWSDGTITQTVAIAPVVTPDQSRLYRFLAQPDQLGDLTLRFQTEPYVAPNDPRSLGFRMHGITLMAAGLRWPSWAQLGWLAGALALCYGLARRLDIRQRWASVAGLGLAALLALLLARERLWLTIFTPSLFQLLVGCYLLTTVLLTIYDLRFTIYDLRSEHRPSSIVHRPSSIVLLIVLAFALRLGGMLHPHTIFSDIGLNANDVLEFTVGNVYFTEGLPSEAGGGQAPYPPGQFIVLAPGQFLVPTNDDGRKLLVKIGNALLDSLVVGLLWYMLRRAGASERAALFGAALYIAPTPLLGSFSVGEFANIFGQDLAMPLLALLAGAGEHAGSPLRHGSVGEHAGSPLRRGSVGEHAGSPLRRGSVGEHAGSPLRRGSVGEHAGSPLHGRWMFAVALLALALLGHLGVAISLAAMLASLAVLWLLAPPARRSFVPLLLVGVVAGAFVAIFYYSAFAQLLSERFVGGTQAISGALSLGEKLVRQQQLLVISPLLFGLGAVGGLLLRRSVRSMWLRLLLGAWWLGTLLSFGLLLFANQAVRWQHFLYPALCLGGGLLLAALWRRGRAARLVVIITLLFIIGQSVVLWIERLIDYLH